LETVGEEIQSRSVHGRLYVAAQLGLLAAVAFGPRSVGLGEPWAEPWGQVAKTVGVVLGLLGGFAAGAGALQLGPNLSPWPGPRDDAQLVRSGVYKLVRHPIYSGLILGAFGWGLFINGSLTVLYALLLTVLMDAKARYEERLLRKRFETYAAYQRKVARFIPFTY
jgi:protein-S-isoprenylcysteine O-methyltransferase Ste14